MNETKLVRDLMTVGVITCPANTPISDVARLILEKNLEAVVVLDKEGHGLGVIGQDELIRVYSRDDARSLSTEDAMSEGVPEIPADIPLNLAAQIMQDNKIRFAYMMHNSKGLVYPAAFISYQHLIRHLAARNDEELRDLGILAERKSPLDVFIQKRDAARRQTQLRKEE